MLTYENILLKLMRIVAYKGQEKNTLYSSSIHYKLHKEHNRKSCSIERL